MDEKYKEFVSLVEKMRKAQKDYFKGRDRTDLDKSRQLERSVDKFITELSDNQVKMEL